MLLRVVSWIVFLGVKEQSNEFTKCELGENEKVIELETSTMESRLNSTSAWTKLCALICAFGLTAIQSTVVFAQTSTITVQADKPGAPISKTLFGLFFEDINFGADGGLYPERVKNRSFQFPNPMMGWTQVDRGDTKGQLYVFDQGSVKDTANSHYLRIKAPAGSKGSGVMNEGFRGIGVEKGAEYTFPVSVAHSIGVDH